MMSLECNSGSHHDSFVKNLSAIVPRKGPVIAVDLDDVLSQTSQCVADWHNKVFQTNMSLDSFYYSMWYKNPGWGTVPETLDKVKQFYAADELRYAKPVPGAHDCLKTLRDMGFSLIVVTARIMASEADSTEKWLEKHFDGVFECVVFSSQPEETTGNNGCYIGTTLQKLQICIAMDAKLLVDDLMETAITFGREGRRPVLLFGDYEWNKRVNTDDKWAFHERLDIEGGREWWKEEDVELTPNDAIWRVHDWIEVIEWVRAAQQINRI